MQTTSTTAARQPNSHTDITAAGIRAISTSSMMVRVVSPLWRWGEEVIINGCSI